MGADRRRRRQNIIALAKDNTLRVRDIAEQVGVTERAVAQILSDLQQAKVIKVERHGRRNTYIINSGVGLRHEVEAHRTVADILRLANARPDRR